jgi:hypothetical protein
MNHSALETCVRRLGRNQIRRLLLFLLLIAAAAAGLTLGYHADLRNVYGAPAGLSTYAALEADFAAGRYFIAQPDMEAMQTGFSLAYDEKYVGSYYALAFSDEQGAIDHLVLYRVQAKYGNDLWIRLPVSGQLSRIDELGLDGRRQWIDELVRSDVYPEMNRVAWERVISDQYILYNNDQRTTIWVLTGVAALLALWLLIALGRALRLQGDYRAHKFCRKLAENLHAPLEDLEQELEADEVISAALRDPRAKRAFSPNFLFARSNGPALRRAKDLLWAHHVTTRHYTNGIPTGKTYSVKLYFDGDRKAVMTLACRNQRDAEDTLADLVARYSGAALFGYNKELEQRHQQDFEGFVSQCREELARRAAENPA